MPLLFQMMAVLDFSVDALVFPERAGGGTLYTGGLTPEEIDAVGRLVDVMRRRNRGRE